MKPAQRKIHVARYFLSRPMRTIALTLAALPVFQATGCFPDPIGALNLQLQLLINTTLIGALNTVVQNLLHL